MITFLALLVGFGLGYIGIEYRIRRNAGMLRCPSCITLPFGWTLLRPFRDLPPGGIAWEVTRSHAGQEIGVVWVDEHPTPRQIMVARDFARRQPGWNKVQVLVMRKVDKVPAMEYENSQ